MNRDKRKAFTIVELVIVIAVIAILAAVLIPTFSTVIKKAKDSYFVQNKRNESLEDLVESMLAGDDYTVAEKETNREETGGRIDELKNDLADLLEAIENITKSTYSMSYSGAFGDKLDSYLKNNGYKLIFGSNDGLRDSFSYSYGDKYNIYYSYFVYDAETKKHRISGEVQIRFYDDIASTGESVYYVVAAYHTDQNFETFKIKTVKITELKG